MKSPENNLKGSRRRGQATGLPDGVVRLEGGTDEGGQMKSPLAAIY